MKYLTSSLGICIALLSCAVVAQDRKRIPPFSRLDAVGGAHAESDDFKGLLQDYQFSPNPKRDNSWGSGFGVFLERSKTGLISIGIRPPSSATNMPTYQGNLPKGLKPEDTIESLKRKLGQPDRIEEPETGYAVMHYNGYRIIALDGKLFEIWLTELKKEAEPTDATKDRASRFGNGKSTAGPR